MELKDRVDKYTTTDLCRDLLGLCSKMHYLAETVNEQKDTIIVVVFFGETEDEVH